MTGTLFVVATPIGNLEDITLRALRMLAECDYILCEDTRVTAKLLAHYDITTPTRRYDAHTSERAHEAIVADLEAGKQIALVSDAGTPGVSDPGVLLVARASEAGARVEPIPGPSALTATFSVAGLSGNQFTFLGFVPQKKGRQTFFTALTTYDHPVIFFESTHRILKTLEVLTNLPPEYMLVVGKELTKLHERVIKDSPQAVFELFQTTPELQKGEFVIIVAPKENTIY